MNELKEKAFAKLNISLDVLYRRADGYHDLAMVMQTVSLCDEVRIVPHDGETVRAVTNMGFIPGDERNLAVKAAKIFFSEASVPFQGMDIEITKNIPVGAGLAGGSADAGAVLRALNRAFGEPLDREGMITAAEKIGSDVAFCTVGGTMLAEGRGERLTALPPMPECAYVIVMPEFSVSTPELFRKIDGKRLRCHPDTSGIVAALGTGDLRGICRRMYNVFEDVGDRRMRTIAEIKNRLLDCGALGAVMTGTGSAVFGVFGDRKTAGETAEALKKEYRMAGAFENVPILIGQGMQNG